MVLCVGHRKAGMGVGRESKGNEVGKAGRFSWGGSHTLSKTDNFLKKMRLCRSQIKAPKLLDYKVYCTINEQRHASVTSICNVLVFESY